MPRIVKPTLDPSNLEGFDTETTGKDTRHDAKPFFYSFARLEQPPEFYPFRVDPLTRQPIVPKGDLTEIKDRIAQSKGLVLQNAKFDVGACANQDSDFARIWPWDVTHCTLMAGHVLASNQPHDLTSMVQVYLNQNIKPYEDAIKQASKEARAIARRKYPTWKIAREGLEGMPSAKSSGQGNSARGDDKDGLAAYDYWLPFEIAAAEGYPEEHPWYTVLSDYGSVDPTCTLPLFLRQMAILQDRDLWSIYLERIKLLPIVYGMESIGLPIHGDRKQELYAEYEEETNKCVRVCCNLADGEITELPISGSSNALKSVIFDKFKLESNKSSKKTGDPSMDKTVLDYWLSTLDPVSKPHLFVRKLSEYRKRSTSMSYMRSYERFWKPIPNQPGWFILYPSLNPTGTDTLRFSSSNPNEQNISKKGMFEGDTRTLRYCFGPPPGREWWSMDAKNIELRLPAYEAGEEAMIDLFERPDDPPYFGSNHLLAAHILHPKEFDACVNDKGDLDGRIFKKKYASTLYQWTKNGNFAVQYGAIEKSGTADRAYHVKGGQALIAKRLGKISDLNQAQIAHANKYGYVETMPDKTVNPRRGYPLLCTRTSWGGILETVPLSYHIQGTAMWWMMKAMIRCSNFLQQWNDANKAIPFLQDRILQDMRKLGYHLVAQIHDEMVFDFPKGSGPEPWKTNLPVVRHLMKLMEQSGDDIGVPTPTSCEYHEHSWAEGQSIDVTTVAV